MPTMPGLCGVILAAGASSRMGRDKALLPWPPGATEGSTLLSAAILALRPFTEAVVVVTGKNAENLVHVIETCGGSMARNPVPERGQFSSLQVGLRAALACGCNAAMITPVDCPPLSAITLELLVNQFKKAVPRGLWAVAPQGDSRRGHPLLASHELIEAFLSAPVTGNAREVKHAHAQFFEYIPVPDLHLSADMNTPEEYAALSALARQNLR
ncbi:MAG TPA: nucleotidyltransferase family protein [Terracidiphilus sp.]|jgi:CTP:molybdopterin cytidylyltransferase MocA